MIVNRSTPRTRGVAILAAVAAVAGVVWLLAVSRSVPTLSPVGETLSEAQLPSAMELLRREGIAVQASQGGLSVPSDQVDRARAVLAYEHLAEPDATSALSQLAGESDPWTTSEQSTKRWHAAKMADLGRIIGMFPPVRSAAVIYDPGSPQAIGRSALRPTASVRVSLKSSAAMDRKLIDAIADLVSGAVAGLDRSDVRIVDNEGRSYRVTPAIADGQADRLDQIARLEDFHRARIQSALEHVPGAVIGLRVEGDAPGRCVAATVSLPWSYLAEAYRRKHVHAARSEEKVEEFAAEQMSAVAATVAQVAGIADPSAVNVSWRYDDRTAVAETATAAHTGPTTALAGVLALFGALSGAGWVTLRWRRMRRRRMAEGVTTASAAGAAVDDPLEFLSARTPEELARLLHQEHPQTAAVVLASLPPDRSAQVLANLEADDQVEVTRRIASMDRLDSQAVAEVVRGLSGRLDQDDPRGRSGITLAARILHHAPGTMERSVMAGISGDEPSLAESIRRRMFSFEDIASLSSGQIREALDDFGVDELAVALRTAAEQLKTKVLSGLSPASSRQVRQEMERMGPVRLSDVEAAQEHVAEAVRRSLAGRYAGSPAQRVSEYLA